jgi:hypothetical protein
MTYKNRPPAPEKMSLVSCVLLALMHMPLAAQTVSTAQPAVSGAQKIGFFSATAAISAVPPPWRIIQFDTKIPATEYRVVLWDGQASVQATANASMALLARPLAIDLPATPVLCWRWRVDGTVKTADMTTKAGDDYAARVYVAFKLPPEDMGFGLRTKLSMARSIYGDHVPDAAINYVWDNRQAIGTRRPNAYTDRTHMVVMRTGDAQAGTWVQERVNVLQDVTSIFNSPRAQATLIALASDTDNTGETARSGFAQLHFVAVNEPCQFANSADDLD